MMYFKNLISKISYNQQVGFKVKIIVLILKIKNLLYRQVNYNLLFK